MLKEGLEHVDSAMLKLLDEMRLQIEEEIAALADFTQKRLYILDAQALQLPDHVEVARDLEDHLGILDLAPRRSPGERFVSADLLRLEIEQRLKDRSDRA